MSQGTVQAIESKSGQGRRGPWTLWRVQIDGRWYSYGFDAPPPAKEGDVVSFAAVDGDKGANIVKGSLAVIQPTTKAKSEVPAASTTQPDRTVSIVMQHSQEMAIRHVSNLLTAGAISLSGTGKASEAKRYAELTAITDKLTIKFYNDAVAGRLLGVVADTPPVAETAADSPIPQPKNNGLTNDLLGAS